MDSLVEYFKKRGYSAKYLPGDRVGGKWNGIPFIGTVAVDRKLSEKGKPHVVIFSDLPIKYDDKYHRTITVEHKHIHRRK